MSLGSPAARDGNCDFELIGAAEETLRTPEVDVVPLNEAPPLMQLGAQGHLAE
jgi:hypothetical protein